MAEPGVFADLLDAQAARAATLPPVHRWQPKLCGDMDLRIARDGVWYHEGQPIRRAPLVNLFARILRREGDAYYLVSPEEKWRIQVDDAPFVAIAVEAVKRDSQQALIFTLLTEDRILAGPENPLRVSIDAASGEPSPYLRVRPGLDARLARTVFYQLANIAAPSPHQPGVYGVVSLGVFYPLM